MATTFSSILFTSVKLTQPTNDKSVRIHASEISVMQPTTFGERVDVAKQMCHKLDISIPTLIDGLDNAVGTAYSGSPDRLYLVARSGNDRLQRRPGTVRIPTGGVGNGYQQGIGELNRVILSWN